MIDRADRNGIDRDVKFHQQPIQKLLRRLDSVLAWVSVILSGDRGILSKGNMHSQHLAGTKANHQDQITPGCGH